jgi:hypothetical protein
VPVTREVLRLLWQVGAYSWHLRRPSLWLFAVVGAVVVGLIAFTVTAAPVLIYPLL